MKISEMATDKAFDTMSKLIPYISEFANDKELAAVADEFREKREIMGTMEKLFPIMVTRHREALYGMISVTTGKKIEKIRTQPISVTKEDFDETMCDDVFDFFPYFLRMAVHL